jgi:hypothetical protein
MMNSQDFNTQSSNVRYSFCPSPVHDRAFLILKGDGGGNPDIVGDYTVLDVGEDKSLSEKKVMNLISLLNGRKNVMPLGSETRARVLYRIVTDADDDGRSHVLFYHLGNEGVSVENALFRLKKEESHA